MKIISGGQTGVDRAALDAAIHCAVPCGGWCPTGRKSEDGTIPLTYPLKELKGGYKSRTIKNVQYSDCTIIIYYEKLRGGTELTHQTCLDDNKPVLLINAIKNTPIEASTKIKHFVNEHSCEIINFAGPRASEVPQAYEYTHFVVSGFINLAKVKKAT